MSDITLARLCEGPDRRGERRVHFFDAHQHDQGGTRKAFCGFTAHQTVLELVPDVAGLGCELCIAEASVGTQGRISGRGLPEDDPDSTVTYAVALRGEFVCHRVPARPVTDVYEGREVVVTECGRIAFLMFGTPPERYESCLDCRWPPEAPE
ncbi:hypothetical protein [Actinopolyspora mortivallis]|uniref:Uncharacterized protein n=1 Tax=Actinopolyspora mortivallis TaxID=33906 RepID=A0A2T0H006_ACTMO|nr:hypothetical protein [Actinopolyspora mortivallis]PRW64677.1 hypothetical protein CEP50_04855 [Actinopolyspora mortivallis]